MSKWQQHDGQSVPVDADSEVKVRRRGGDRDSRPQWAGRWLSEEPTPWRWEPGSENGGDIVEFKVIRAEGRDAVEGGDA